jgi:hypothetical protein
VAEGVKFELTIRRANILGFERRQPTISSLRYPASCFRAIGRNSNRVSKPGEAEDKGEYRIYIARHKWYEV